MQTLKLPSIRLEKRGREWAVFLRKRVVYASGCYAKAVGVCEFLEARQSQNDRETKFIQRQFMAAYNGKAG